jgi:GAF domain-containing protein
MDESQTGAGRGAPLQAVVDELIAATTGSRATLRVADREGAFPVVAEALAPGVRSIAAETSIDLRSAPTFQYLERELRTLVQDDILASDVAPPPELVQRYGARAQLLAPVVERDRMIAFLSVHHAATPRAWTEAEVAAIEAAAVRVAALLASERTGRSGR